MSNAVGWRCAVCGARRSIDEPMPWRCPDAGDDRHHVLQLERRLAPLRPSDHANPFVAYDDEFAWSAFAAACGLDAERRAALVDDVDRRLLEVDGRGFRATPLLRADRLSAHLGFSSEGGLWVKDETNNVAGSHKARHLQSILLHLLAAESAGVAPWSTVDVRPPLAIASCGNAALAAATLAAAARWPLQVFVPPSADEIVLARLRELGATIQFCPRLANDPPGDPCIHRFRAAVAAGAVPFSVQGPENGLCLDGGRTLGWEIVAELGHESDRVFVQTGGGAFVACVGAAFAAAGVHPRVHAVQTAGCAPLQRAWQRADALEGGRASAASHWGDCMTPWEQEPVSLADGILDDETYDWLGAFAAMQTGGSPVVAAEADVVAAYELAHRTTAIDVSPTGAAGLAGVLAVREQLGDDERVVVVFSGVRRGTPRPAGVA
jgi:threonine dehydratase